MPKTITLDQLRLDSLTLKHDRAGNVVGEIAYTMLASGAAGFGRSGRKQITFTAPEQTQIKNFVAGKLATIKTAEGI